jgi:hypothetical protein
MVPCLPLREGYDIINHCAWRWVDPIIEQPRVDAFGHNNKSQLVLILSINLCKSCLKTYNSLSIFREVQGLNPPSPKSFVNSA